MPLTPVTWLDEFTVNLTTTGTQIAPVITQLTNGNIVVVWQSNDDTGVGSPNGLDLIGQIFDPLGNPIGAEFLANPGASAFPETAPTITALAGGGFAVAFERNETGFRDIVLQTFNASGAAVTAQSVFLDGAANTLPEAFDPAIASSSATSILTVWREDEAGGDSRIMGRIFDSSTNGFPGDAFVVMDAAEIDADPVVTVLNNGNYVIAGRTDGAGGDSSITLRILSSTGAEVLAATPIASTVGNIDGDREPAITALAGGGFVVTWTNVDADTDIIRQIFDQNGALLGTATGVSASGNVNSNAESVVVPLSDGGFIVIWDDNEAGTLSARRQDNLGNNVGVVFQLAPGATLGNLDAVALEDGRIALTFTRADGEIGMEILDVRDATTTGGYTPDIQIGTIGNDTVTSDFTAGNLYGHDGDDVITELGLARSYFGGEGNDTLIVTSGINSDAHFGGGGVGDAIDWTNALFGGTFDLAAGTATDGIGTEVMQGFENLTGTSGRDRITGNNFTNRLFGGGANDTIFGGLGFQDSLYGGDGDDSLTSDGDGGDYFGGTGNDTLISGDGAESMSGDGDIDTIDHRGFDLDYEFDMATGLTNFVAERYQQFEIVLMGDGNDSVRGTANGDTVFGGLGGDTLRGNQGADSLDGGLGEDHFWGGAGADTLNGGELDDEIDFARYDDTNAGITISLATPGSNTGDAAGDVYNGIEGIVGSTGNDIIFGNAEVNQLLGNNGNDVVRGAGGDDLLDGGSGDDDLYGGLGADILIGGSGVDFAAYIEAAGAVRVDMASTALNTGEAAGDAYFGVEGVAGSNFTDTLAGNAAANLIYGYDGNDIVEGRGGNDVLAGNSGNDMLSGGAGADFLDGGSGFDLARYDDANHGNLVIRLDLPGSNTGAAAGDTYLDIEGLVGGVGNDSVYGSNTGNTLFGGAGDDYVAGAGGNDVLNGGTGNDRILGGVGLDTLTGGAGVDSFFFNTAILAGDFDRISDFTSADDTMRLDDLIFTGLATGTLASTAFAANLTGAAGDASDRIIYETDTGRLYFDADGTGATARLLFATLAPNLTLSNADFVIF